MIELPWVRPALVEAMRRDRRDRQSSQRPSVPELREAPRGAGLLDISVGATTLVLTDPDDAVRLPGVDAARAEEGHGPTLADVEEWEAGVEQARREPGFVYAVVVPGDDRAPSAVSAPVRPAQMARYNSSRSAQSVGSTSGDAVRVSTR